jgi:hypothetical protein
MKLVHGMMVIIQDKDGFRSRWGGIAQHYLGKPLRVIDRSKIYGARFGGDLVVFRHTVEKLDDIFCCDCLYVSDLMKYGLIEVPQVKYKKAGKLP